MEDPAIYREIEALMPKVVKGNRKALKAVMRSEWMLSFLSCIADWAERQKKIEVDERGTSIQEVVAARIREKLHTVKNPNNAPWHRVLTKWSYRVASRRCEDVRKKSTRLIEGYKREVARECMQRKEHGVKKIFEMASTAPSPEEELERKEQSPLRERIESKIHRTTLEAHDAATAEEKLILHLWLQGKKLQQISDQMGIPLANVHRKLKRIQKAIVAKVEKGVAEEIGEAEVKACGVADVLQKVVKDRDELSELLASSSENVLGRANAPPLCT